MNNNTANPPTDPSAYIAALVQQQGLPMPAGTTENGEPFWIIGDRRIMWAEMQQFVWQAQQAQAKAQAAAAGGRGGPEIAPVMPQMPTSMPDGSMEQRLEQEQLPSPETSGEKQEQRAEQAEQPSQAQQAQPTATAPKRASSTSPYIGDSPKLAQVDISDPSSMTQFYQQNKQGKGNPNESNTFLAMLLGKILRSFFRSSGIE